MALCNYFHLRSHSLRRRGQAGRERGAPSRSFDCLSLFLQDVLEEGPIRYVLDPDRQAVLQRGVESNGERALESFVMEHQRPVCRPLSELATDFAEIEQRLVSLGMRSLCALPLTTPTRRLGTLAMASRQAGAYPPETVEYLSFVADEIALAIDRTASYERLRVARKELKRSHERGELVQAVGRSILSILDLPELLRSISANTRRVLGCDAVGVILMDEHEPFWEARIFAGEFLESRGVLAEGAVLPVAGTPLEEVLRTGRPGNLGITDPRGIAAAEGIAGSWAHPLVSRGRTLGALAAASREKACFSAEETELLGQIAGLVAIALDNPRPQRTCRRCANGVRTFRSSCAISCSSSGAG